MAFDGKDVFGSNEEYPNVDSEEQRELTFLSKSHQLAKENRPNEVVQKGIRPNKTRQKMSVPASRTKKKQAETVANAMVMVGDSLAAGFQAIANTKSSSNDVDRLKQFLSEQKKEFDNQTEVIKNLVTGRRSKPRHQTD